MLPLLYKEIRAFFTTAVGYIALGCFLLWVGGMVWVFPATNVLDLGQATLQPFFDVAPYILLVFIPALTMHIIAEERKRGTLPYLYVLPVSLTDILMAKYLAALFVVAVGLSLTLPYYVALYFLALPVGNIDTAAIFTSYCGLYLLACTFTALGVLSSACTNNQLLAWLFGTMLCLALHLGFKIGASLWPWNSWAYLLYTLSSAYRYEALGKGVIDVKDILYFFTVIFTTLVLAHKRLQHYQKSHV